MTRPATLWDILEPFKALAAADALAAAVEAHSFAFSDDTALAILSRLAEYRKIRPRSAPEPKGP